MRRAWIVWVLAACSTTESAKSSPQPLPPAETAQPPQPAGSDRPDESDPAMTKDRDTPGGTGVDEHGVLLRSKPDPNAPKPDPKLVADNDAQLLFAAGALVGDPGLQRRTWQQLGLVDAAGTPTPKMTEFIRAHQEWAKEHGRLAESVSTPDKARAYLDAHLKK